VPVSDAFDGPDLRRSAEKSLGRAAAGRALIAAYVVRRGVDGEKNRQGSAGRATRNGRPMRRPGIDVCDIAEGSPAQLRMMRRVGGPPWGRRAGDPLRFGSIPRFSTPCGARPSGVGLVTSPSSTNSSQSASAERGAPEPLRRPRGRARSLHRCCAALRRSCRLAEACHEPRGRSATPSSCASRSVRSTQNGTRRSWKTSWASARCAAAPGAASSCDATVARSRQVRASS
jgi:hypothetical protein